MNPAATPVQPAAVALSEASVGTAPRSEIAIMLNDSQRKIGSWNAWAKGRKCAPTTNTTQTRTAFGRSRTLLMTAAPKGIATSIVATEIPYVRNAERLGGTRSTSGPRRTTNQTIAANTPAAVMRQKTAAGTVPALTMTNNSPATAPMTDPMGFVRTRHVYTSRTGRHRSVQGTVSGAGDSAVQRQLGRPVAGSATGTIKTAKE